MLYIMQMTFLHPSLKSFVVIYTITFLYTQAKLSFVGQRGCNDEIILDNIMEKELFSMLSVGNIVYYTDRDNWY